MPPDKSGLSWDDGVTHLPKDAWDSAPTTISSDQGEIRNPTAFEQARDAVGEGADFVKNSIATAVPEMGQDAVSSAKGVNNFITDAAAQAPDDTSTDALGSNPASKLFSSVGETIINSLQGAGNAIGNKIADIPSKERAALAVRLGTSAVAAYLTGGQSSLVQGAAVAGGNQVGRMINEQSGLEDGSKTTSKDDWSRFGVDTVKGALGMFLGKTLGKGLSATGEKIEGASNSTDNVIEAAKAQPEYLAGRFMQGKNIDKEAGLIKTLQDGRKEFAQVLTSEIPDDVNTAKGLSDAFDESLARRNTIKTGIVKDMDKALQSSIQSNHPGIDPFTVKDAGLSDLQDMAASLKKTGVGSDKARAVNEVIDEVKSGFQQDHPSAAMRSTGTKIFISKSFQEMQDQLDAAYGKLRELKAFDDSARATGQIDPSAIAANKAKVEAYESVADSIKSSMAAKAKALENAGTLAEGSLDDLQTVNDQLNKLIPWKVPLSRFVTAAQQASSQASPKSLISALGNGGLQSARGQVMDELTSPITDPILDRATARTSLDYAPQTISDAKDAAAYALGKPAPDVSQGSGITGMVGAGMNAAGQALQAGAAPAAAAAIPVLSTLKDRDPGLGNSLQTFDEFMADPQSIALLKAHPEIPPEDIDNLMQAKNGTMIEKAMAFGKLKIDARNTGIFPPSPMQGIHSFISTPTLKNDGQKVLGIISDDLEGHVYLDAVNAIPDVERRIRLKNAYNKGRYVMEIPNTLKPAPKAEPTPAPTPEPQSEIPKVTSTKIYSNGSDSMDRVVQPY